MRDKLIFAAKILLAVWMGAKVLDMAAMLISLGAVNFTFLHPSVEEAFVTLVFVKETSVGLTLFIALFAVTMLGCPMSFLVFSGSRRQRIVGFCAYATVTVIDIISACVLHPKEEMMLLSLGLHLLILCILCFYGKQAVFSKESPSAEAE